MADRANVAMEVWFVMGFFAIRFCKAAIVFAGRARTAKSGQIAPIAGLHTSLDVLVS
jgi:hypothetical protein